MDVFDRIYQLHGLFSSHRRPIPLKDILVALECSEATFKRAKQRMVDYLGAPIVYDRASNGYFYQRNKNDIYELPGLWFSSRELLSLLLIETQISQLSSGFLKDIIEPLKERTLAILEKSDSAAKKNLHRIKVTPIANRVANDGIVAILIPALLERRKIQIDYLGRKDESSNRRLISPQRMIRYRDNWYLDAFCHQANEIRIFAAERIEAALATDEVAYDVAEAALDEQLTLGYGIFGGKPIANAVLIFNQQVARWVAEENWHPEQIGEWLTDGRYQLRFPYSNPTELIMDVLRHGANVEVMGPEALREAVKERVQQLVRLYELTV